MNESLDIIGSYLIGGAIVLALVALTLTYNNRAQETKLSEIAQRTTQDAGKIIEYDFNKLGYRVTTGNKIISITKSSITFLADLDNNATTDTITYSVIKQNDGLYLSREVTAGSQTKSWTMPVQSFNISGIDSTGSSTYNTANVKGISISFVTSKQSSSLYTIGAFWQRDFFPKNL